MRVRRLVGLPVSAYYLPTGTNNAKRDTMRVEYLRHSPTALMLLREYVATCPFPFDAGRLEPTLAPGAVTPGFEFTRWYSRVRKRNRNRTLRHSRALRSCSYLH